MKEIFFKKKSQIQKKTETRYDKNGIKVSMFYTVKDVDEETMIKERIISL